MRTAILAALLLASPLTAQPEPTPLNVGQPVESSLTTGDTHTYTLKLGENYFVSGTANQITVDVVVKIFNEDDVELANFDGPGRGPEFFSFESQSAGTYRIQVTPFEDETGDYKITLDIAEPIATDPARRVDQLMAPFSADETPGGVIGVVQQGKLTFARAYGAANLTHHIPFTIDTLNNIGSTSKQFTAYAIMLLAEQGKLNIDDDVRKHIPELPEFDHTVTIRHLMTHTSGYREFLNTVILSGRRLDHGDYIDQSEIIALVQRQPKLQNDPGAEWNYNNTAFALLAEIVTRVGGEPFPDWMKHNVFQPLDMNHTFVRGNSSTIIENSSQGYTPTPEGRWRLAADLGASSGAGGIYASVPDLAKWVTNYKTGQLGGPEIFQQMTTPFVLTSGDPTSYGFGLFIDEFKGQKRIQHGGADAAHRSMVMYFPEFDSAVITQSNNAIFGGVADKIAQAFFADHFANDEETEASESDETDVAEAFDPADFDPDSLDAFVGRYEMEEITGFIIEFTREGDKFYGQATGQPKAELIPESPTRFKVSIVDASISFHPESDGTVKSLTIHQGGDHKANRLPDEAFAPTAEQLAAYTGRYFSEELETFYHLAIEDEALTLNQRRFPAPLKLKPVKEHFFTGSMPIAEARFETDDEGNITALIVSNGRTKNVRFEPFN